MAELVADCPRCTTKRVTFDLKQATSAGNQGWKDLYEAFCVCRHCHKSTIFVLSLSSPQMKAFLPSPENLVAIKGVVNSFVDVVRYVSAKDVASISAPEHLPPTIAAVFDEGATCKAVGCYNAAATMFRLCLDLATRDKLPPIGHDASTGPNYKTRRDLGLRLPWLFDNKVLPEDLRDLSHAVKEDGNDGAHAGSMTAVDVDDLIDFTTALLERIYTEPTRVQLAKSRRDARRNPGSS